MSKTREDLSNIWKHRALLKQFAQRNIELRHKGSHLGVFWSVANPLLLLVVYVFVFRYVFGGNYGVLAHETRWDYAFALFVSLTVYQFLTEIIATSPIIVVVNPNYVKKVVFPLEILPIATVASSAYNATITMLLALAGTAFLGPGLSWTLVWLPLILLPVLLMGAGLAWLLSALGVFFRDLSQMTQFLTTALMFASAIFYSAASIPRNIWLLLRFNPLIHAVELTRDVAVWHLSPPALPLLYLNAFGLVTALVGLKAFHRLRPTFADVL